jgi:plastocyanin
MKTFRRFTGCVPLGFALFSFCSARTVWAATFNVNIGNNFFNPASLTIDVNDTVRWSWIGNNHSTTSNTGLWDSGVRNSGATFSRQFTAVGNFPYRCTVHFGQNGTITVQGPNTPPTVTITSPTNNAVFTAPASFTFSATASDPGGSVASVQFFRDSTSFGTDMASPYSVMVSSLAAGNYTLSAVATDNQGARATNLVSIIVNALPTVNITSPTDGTIMAAPYSGTIQATATDSDGTISKVDFYANTNLLGTDTLSPYSLAVSNLAAGTHTLTAVATDNRGASNASAGVILSVVTPLPVLLSSPRRMSSNQFVFFHTANVGLRYRVERSVNFSNWTNLQTNIATNNPMRVMDSTASNAIWFYRVGRLPNP